MSHYHRSHHDSSSSTYQMHIMSIGKLDYCLGCLGSKLFLIIALPVLLALFVYPNTMINSILDWSVIGLLWVITTASFVYELTTKRDIKSRWVFVLNNLYLIGSISYVIIVPNRLSVNHTIMLSIFLALPQIGIYLHKSVTQKEFKHKKTKLLLRLSFIIAFFFAISNVTQNFYVKLLIIVFGILIFTRLRSFSDFRVNPDKFLLSSISLSDDSMKLNFLHKLNLFNSNGQVREINATTSRLSKIYLITILSILYLFGVVIVGSNLPSLANCATEAYPSVISVTPWIVMKSSSQKFCSECGVSSPMEYTFCESCGTQFELQTGSQQPPAQSAYPPQQGSYPQNQQYNRGYQGQGYQPYPGQGHQRQDQSKRIPIGVAVVVGLVVLLLTGNIIFALVMGVVAYFGTVLAMSTNNPCLGYCIMSQCIDCICSATAGERRRGGKF